MKSLVIDICNWFEKGVPIGLIPFLVDISYGVRLTADEIFAILVEAKCMPWIWTE